MKAVRPPRRLHCHAPNAFCAGLAFLQLAQALVSEVKSNPVRYHSTAAAEPHATSTHQPVADRPLKITRTLYTPKEQDGKQWTHHKDASGGSRRINLTLPEKQDDNQDLSKKGVASHKGKGLKETHWESAKRILREGLKHRRQKATQIVKDHVAGHGSPKAPLGTSEKSEDEDLIERLIFHKDELMAAYHQAYKDDFKGLYQYGIIQETPPIDGFKTIWKPHMIALRDFIRKMPEYFHSLSKVEATQIPFLLSYGGHSIGPEASERRVRLPIPWKVENSDSLSSGELLEEEFRRFLMYMELSAAEKAARQAVLEDLNAAIPLALGEEKNSTWKLEPFGSEVTGLALPGSDLDVRLVKPDAENYKNEKVLAKLVDYLSSTDEYLVTNMRMDSHAIAVLQHRRSGIEVQIVFFANPEPQQRVTARLLDEIPNLHDMYLLLRSILKVRDLGDVYTGGLGSYATFCLAAAALLELRGGSSDNSSSFAISNLLSWLADLNTRFFGVQVSRSRTRWKKQSVRDQYHDNKIALGMEFKFTNEMAVSSDSEDQANFGSDESHAPAAFGDGSSPSMPEVKIAPAAADTAIADAFHPVDHSAGNILSHSETRSRQGVVTDVSQIHRHDIRDSHTFPPALQADLSEPHSHDVTIEIGDHEAGADRALVDIKENPGDARGNFDGDAEHTSWLNASNTAAHSTTASSSSATGSTSSTVSNGPKVIDRKRTNNMRLRGKAIMLQRHETRPWMLALQDPVSAVNDLGAHAFAIKHILATARTYHAALCRDMQAHDEAHNSGRPSPVRSLLLPLVGRYHEHLYEIRERADVYGTWVLAGRKGEPPPLQAPTPPVPSNSSLIMKVNAKANWGPASKDLDFSQPAAEVPKPEFSAKKPESFASKLEKGWSL